jgi:putative ABC transport system ATP-binding protein
MTLRLDTVSLTYGDGDEQVRALDEVSLEVHPGELVAVVGPSGSGKSSLLAVAGALQTPDAGQVVIDSVEVTRASKTERARIRRERIGFVFQSDNLIPSLTVLEQLLLPLYLRGKRPRQGRDAALRLLEEVGLSHRVRHRPHQLSGGERQRVGIARALMNRPAVLLVDEPTSALDHRRSRDIVELLAKETATHQVATVMVTHDHSILHHADRILSMEDGRLRPLESRTSAAAVDPPRG